MAALRIALLALPGLLALPVPCVVRPGQSEHEQPTFPTADVRTPARPSPSALRARPPRVRVGPDRCA